MRSLLALALLATLAAARVAPAQGGLLPESKIEDQVLVFVADPVTFRQRVARFDRTLHLLGVTDFPPNGILNYSNDHEVTVSLDRLGRTWIPLDPLINAEVMVLDPQGSFLPSVPLSHNPMQSAAGPDGEVYVLTRIPLLTKGPLYALRSDGSLKWSSFAAVAPFDSGIPPMSIAATSQGRLYVGGSKWFLPTGGQTALVVEVDPATGAPLASITYPVNPTVAGTVTVSLQGAPDGTVWAFVSTATGFRHVNIRGSTIVKDFAALGGYNGATQTPRVDGKGDLYGVSYDSPPASSGKDILKVSGETGQPIGFFPLNAGIAAFALGPSGEEMFLLAATMPTNRYLVRLNLVTGVRSRLLLDPQMPASILCGGDPTGFVFANVVDREGDADSDGVRNGAETAAGTNPFDPTSVPWGPKVYLSFTPQNAIVLRIVDPDGLRDSAGGVVALSLEAEGFGNVLPALMPFLTSATAGAHGTEATLTFGGLALRPNLKVRLIARALDATGAVGEDWAVTPPGDL
jgi:hypothetical protein